MDQNLMKKLKLASFQKIALLKQSKDDITAFDGFERFTNQIESVDLAIAYVYSLTEMQSIITYCFKNQLIVKEGQLYIAYPKQKNTLKHEAIHRDAIFPFLNVDEETGYVKNIDYKFNRMVSLDENYTLVALKYLPQNIKSKIRPSGKVADYKHYQYELLSYLCAFPSALKAYESLTPGYQNDWLRYIYSAKLQQTQIKRRDEMVQILNAGYKSKQLYQTALKTIKGE